MAKAPCRQRAGALSQQPYGFNTRFEGVKGTNPEELIGAAHAACFSMALSLMLSEEGYTATSIDTTAVVTLNKTDGGFAITDIALQSQIVLPDVAPAAFDEIIQKAKAGLPGIAGAESQYHSRLPAESVSCRARAQRAPFSQYLSLRCPIVVSFVL